MNKAQDRKKKQAKRNNSLKSSRSKDMGKEASPLEPGSEQSDRHQEEEEDCKECQAKKCITGCAQTFR